MRTLRRRPSLVWLSLAVLVCAALVPGAATILTSAVLTALWFIVPALAIAVGRPTAAPASSQLLSLVSIALFRAPPVALPVA